MTPATLPSALRPRRADLIRLGRDGDGGYLVCPEDVRDAAALLSFGLASDWSFEQGFTRRNPVPVVACDGSVSLASLILAQTQPGRFQRLRASVALAWRYLRYFRGNRRHVMRQLGPEAGPGDHITLGALLAETGQRAVFIKMDIEGSEYDVLDDLLAHQAQITGLAIEFHDCANRIAAILDFIAAFDLTLVHLHLNNYGPVADNGLPTVLELTFSRGTTRQSPPAGLPHSLDQANTTDRSDIAISFAD